MRLGCLAIFALLLLACGGGKESAPKPKPTLVRFAEGTPLDADGAARLDFGELVVGRKARANLVLENLSDRSLPVKVDTPESPFSLVDAPEALPPRALASLVFRFAPVEASPAIQEVGIRVGEERLRIRLSGGTAAVEENCAFSVSPPSIRLRVGSQDPGMDWNFPLSIQVDEGRCVIEEARGEGDFEVALPDVKGNVLLGGTRTEILVRVGAPSPGEEGAVRLRIEGREVEIPIQVVEAVDCASIDPQLLEIELGLGCGEAYEIHFGGDCESTPRLVGTEVFPEEERRFLQVETREGVTSLVYTPSEAQHESEATVIFDFDNGDRLYLPVRARPKMHEVQFVVPERALDLLILVDQRPAMDQLEDLLDEVAADLWAWMAESVWKVSVGVTTTRTTEEFDCPMTGEGGRLLPLDGSPPRLIAKDTPDGASLLRERLSPEPCSEKEPQGLSALYSSLSTNQAEPWGVSGATKGALFIVAESDNSISEPEIYRQLFSQYGLEYLHVIGPCHEGQLGGRYGALAREFLGVFQPRCALLPHVPILNALEEMATLPFRFELEVPADVDDPLSATESEGVAVFVGDAPLYSGAFPGWTVAVEGTEFRLNWGLEPGTEITVRYPLERCHDDGL